MDILNYNLDVIHDDECEAFDVRGGGTSTATTVASAFVLLDFKQSRLLLLCAFIYKLADVVIDLLLLEGHAVELLKVPS